MEVNFVYLKNVDKLNEFTKREVEILCLLADGYKNQVIAEKLYISTRTVDTHKRRMIKKINLGNACELTCFAVKIKNIIDESKKD